MPQWSAAVAVELNVMRLQKMIARATHFVRLRSLPFIFCPKVYGTYSYTTFWLKFAGFIIIIIEAMKMFCEIQNMCFYFYRSNKPITVFQNQFYAPSFGRGVSNYTSHIHSYLLRRQTTPGHYPLKDPTYF